MLGIILEVIVILSCPLRLQEEHKDPLYSVVILVRNEGVLMLFLESWRTGEDDNDLQDDS